MAQAIAPLIAADIDDGAPPDAGPRPRRAGRGRQPPPRRAGRRLRPRRAGPPGRRPRLGRPARGPARVRRPDDLRRTLPGPEHPSASEHGHSTFLSPNGLGGAVATGPLDRRRPRPAARAPSDARALPVSHPAVRWASRTAWSGRPRPAPSATLGPHPPVPRTARRHGLPARHRGSAGAGRRRRGRCSTPASSGCTEASSVSTSSSSSPGTSSPACSSASWPAPGVCRSSAFWARRARRLLPASALVVVVTALGSHLMLPPLTQRSVAVDVVGAATFTSNVVFADRLGSYFGAQLGQSTPSPLLHFWSVAVEEQFYLCWPPLLALLVCRPRQYRRLLLVTIASVGPPRFRPGRVRHATSAVRGRSSCCRRGGRAARRCAARRARHAGPGDPARRAERRWRGPTVPRSSTPPTGSARRYRCPVVVGDLLVLRDETAPHAPDGRVPDPRSSTAALAPDCLAAAG